MVVNEKKKKVYEKIVNNKFANFSFTYKKQITRLAIIRLQQVALLAFCVIYRYY